MDEKDRKTLLALQALILKIKDLVDDFFRTYYSKYRETAKKKGKR